MDPYFHRFTQLPNFVYNMFASKPKLSFSPTFWWMLSGKILQRKEQT